MRMMNLAAVLVLAAAVGSTTSNAQITVVPARGEGIEFPSQWRQLKTGTGEIKGRLVVADTGTPVRRANVRISGPDILPKTATTDNEGAYAFRDLPAGQPVLTKPNVVHWHGAAPDQHAVQFSVYSGTLEWKDAVTDDQYMGKGR